MQKNENQNRWSAIVVGITEPYPGLYLHPGHGEVNPTPSFLSTAAEAGGKKHGSEIVVRSRNVCEEAQWE